MGCDQKSFTLVTINTKKYHVFAPMGRFQLESIYLYFPPSSQLVNNVVIATKGLQDRNINILAGTTVENKGKLILSNNQVKLMSN